MKLLVVNGLSALQGGGQTYLINLLKNLPEGDFEVILIVGRANEAVFSAFASERVKIFVVDWASKSVVHRSLWEIIALPQWLKVWGGTTYYAPGGVMTTLAPKGCFSATALRNMLPFDSAERCRFPLFSYSRFKLWLLRLAYKLSYHLSDRVVFISKYSMGVAEQEVPGVSSKGEVIPHGLNEAFLHAEEEKELPNGLIVGEFYLYVSILDVYKAQKEVVESWKLLKDRGFKFPLVLIGGKYNKYGEEVVELIRGLDLEDQVFYLGAKPYNELPSLYRSARALIFASSCECCPNILLEKMAAGRPVICSVFQPMPEFGGDAVSYFDPYDPMSLVEKVKDLETAKDMDIMGRMAHQQAQQFDWKKTVERTLKFLNVID